MIPHSYIARCSDASIRMDCCTVVTCLLVSCLYRCSAVWTSAKCHSDTVCVTALVGTEQEEVHAMRRLGDCYYHGWQGACQQNYTSAMQWYQTAGQLNSGYALHAVSSMYEQGLGVPRNWSRAWDMLDQITAVDTMGTIPVTLARAHLLMTWLYHTLVLGDACPECGVDVSHYIKECLFDVDRYSLDSGFTRVGPVTISLSYHRSVAIILWGMLATAVTSVVFAVVFFMLRFCTGVVVQV
jgi:hypothetical protein